MKDTSALFEALLGAAQSLEPSAREGKTFGWPAIYVGSRIIACEFDGMVAIKLPRPAARAALEAGQLTRFRPFGMPTNQQWVQFERDAAVSADAFRLLREAVDLGRGTCADENLAVPAVA